MEIKDGKLAVYVKDRATWRRWLAKNSGKNQAVWLILYHQSSLVQCVNRIAATEEALCFGWIDSLCKKRDHESCYLTFGPRNPKKSNWSAPNRERAERMIAEKLMTPQGQTMIDLAKHKGTWEKL